MEFHISLVLLVIEGALVSRVMYPTLIFYAWEIASMSDFTTRLLSLLEVDEDIGSAKECLKA
jgi:hypothetical protein